MTADTYLFAQAQAWLDEDWARMEKTLGPRLEALRMRIPSSLHQADMIRRVRVLICVRIRIRDGRGRRKIRRKRRRRRRSGRRRSAEHTRAEPLQCAAAKRDID